MKYLVTGGAGFLGISLLQQLAREAGCEEIIVLDHIGHTSNPEVLETTRWDCVVSLVRASILDTKIVDQTVRRVDTIIHLAAESYVDYSIDAPQVFSEVNVQGTVTLLDAARRHSIERFVHISTDEVWGDAGANKRFCEADVYAPGNPYAASKAAADHFVRACGRTYGIPYVIIYFTNLFGPYQYPEKFIPRSIVSALSGRRLTIYGDGSHIRTWLHIRDAVDGLLTVLRAGRHDSSYIIGSDAECSNNDIVGMITRSLGLDENAVTYVADRPGHDRRYAVDCSRIRDELHWHPRIAIDAGIKDTVDWYSTNREWWASRLGDIAQRLGLPCMPRCVRGS